MSNMRPGKSVEYTVSPLGVFPVAVSIGDGMMEIGACRIIGTYTTKTNTAVAASPTKCSITNTKISNSYIAASCGTDSSVSLLNLTGTGNDIGMSANNGVVRYNGTLFDSTTLKSMAVGGQILQCY